MSSSVNLKHEEVDSDEYEEEEIVVYADFESYLPFSELSDQNVRLKLIGLDSEHPILQVNTRFFQGTYDYTIGTNVFFAEDDNWPDIDPNFEKNPKKYFKFCEQTNKILKMKRIFVTPENEGDKAKVEEDKSKYLVTKNYEESLNMFLKPGDHPPRHITNAENCSELLGKRLMKQLGNFGTDDEDDDDIMDDARDEDYIPDST